MKSKFFISKEDTYGAHNYHPLPVVLEKGDGVFVWDVEGKKYYDFLSAYSSVSQGHCNKRLVEVMYDQLQTLCISSRAFYNNLLGEFEEFLSKTFGYDKVLPMNTGAEGAETAIKLCRKWAYTKKGIPQNEAVILACERNFHGRTITAISMSTDPDSRNDFGPYTPGFEIITYDNVEALEEKLKNNKNIAGFIVEPIQGEAGVYVPSEGYLKKAYDLCKKYNVLFIADEIQTGLGRTGKMLACEHENVRPDILILGKALSGGTYPISAVLANNDVMLCLKPNEHGSTFGGNPIASRVGIEAVKIIIEDKLSENSERLGYIFRNELNKIENGIIEQVRGKGLLTGMVIRSDGNKNAWNLCMALKENGMLAKPTHDNIIRFAPPLIINEEQIFDSIEIIKKTLDTI